MADLTKQIEREHLEIVNAPLTPLGPMLGRCHFCGQPARDLQLVESIAYEDGEQFDRYKGECCRA